MPRNSLYIGGSFSQKDSNIIESIKKSKKQGGNVIQQYVGDNILTTLRTKESDKKEHINEIKQLLKKNNMNIVIHSMLRLNFCLPHRNKRYKWGIVNALYDIKFASKINAIGTVIHLGHLNNMYKKMTESECRNNYVANIRYLLHNSPKKTKIIIETSYNDIYKLAATIQNLGKLFNKFTNEEKRRIRFCIDTAHIFAFGYDISNINGVNEYFDIWNKYIGLRYITVIHLNDSKVPLKSKKDRHEQLEKGYIFSQKNGALQNIIRIAKQHGWYMVLETRKPSEYDREIKLVKQYFIQYSIQYSIQQVGGIQQKNKFPLICQIFTEMAQYYKIIPKSMQNSANIYRARQYESISRDLNELNITIITIDDIDKLKQQVKIGKSSEEKIKEIIKTGKLQQHDKFKRNKTLNAILKLSHIHGIGPETAQKWANNGYTDVNNIKKGVKMNKLIISKKQKLALNHYNNLQTKIPRLEMKKWDKYFKKLLQKVKWTNYTSLLAGSYIRGKSMSKDIDLVLIKEHGNAQNLSNFIKILKDEGIFVDILSGLKSNNGILLVMNSKISSHVRHLDIRLIIRANYPFFMLYFGSGVVYSRNIRMHAKKMGYKLTEKGIYHQKNGKKVNKQFKTERDIFDFLNISYIPYHDR